MSMRTGWQEAGTKKEVVSPLSLIISAFAPCLDVRKTLTPQLIADTATRLLLIDLGSGKNRLGGSVLAQVYGQAGNESPDVDSSAKLRAFFETIQKLNESGRILAYHDRSDGGLFATLAEMMFAGHVGVTVDIGKLGDGLAAVFNEELGAVLQ